MTEVGGIASDRLRSLIERIERLEEEKKALGSDIRDVYAEAKSAGFDTKIMRTIIKLRKMNASDREERRTLAARRARMGRAVCVLRALLRRIRLALREGMGVGQGRRDGLEESAAIPLCPQAVRDTRRRACPLVRT